MTSRMKLMKTLVTLDFETYYGPKHTLTSLSLFEYVKSDKFKVWGVGIKIDDGTTEWYGEEEAEEALNEIDWEDSILLCHNTPFDGYILTHYYGLTPAYYLDTQAMSRGLYPGQPSSLKELSKRLFPDDETMRKGEELASARGIWDLPPDLEESIGGYCIQDVELTYADYQKMVMDYPQSELDLIDLTTRMLCEPVLKIDRERLTKFHAEELKKAEDIIEASGVAKEELTSNPKFVNVINNLGIVPPTKVSPTTGKTIPAFGKNDAAWQQMREMYPEHEHIWSARVTAKSRISETRAKRFLDAANDDNTMPVPLRYYAAHTGRFGGSEKLNMQNLPRGGELRKCLIAPEGHLVYVADLSNIEARMLAWLAGQDDLLQEFREGQDIYSNFASRIYGRPINKNDDPTERFVGKVAVLGLGYGMGHVKFRQTLASGAMGPPIDVSEKRAGEIVRSYRTTYPSIKALWTRLEDRLVMTMNKASQGEQYSPALTLSHHGFTMPNGLALKYQDLRVDQGQLTFVDKNGLKTTYGGKITENVVQALSRIVITNSMLRLSKRYKVALTVHDEIIIVAPDVNPHATMADIIEDMCQPPDWAPDLPLDAEGGFDTRYSK